MLLLLLLLLLVLSFPFTRNLRPIQMRDHQPLRAKWQSRSDPFANATVREPAIEVRGL